MKSIQYVWLMRNVSNYKIVFENHPLYKLCSKMLWTLAVIKITEQREFNKIFNYHVLVNLTQIHSMKAKYTSMYVLLSTWPSVLLLLFSEQQFLTQFSGKIRDDIKKAVSINVTLYLKYDYILEWRLNI